MRCGMLLNFLKKKLLVICLIVLYRLCCFQEIKADRITNEAEAREWYRKYEDTAIQVTSHYWLMRFEYYTNLTDFNKDRLTAAQLENSEFQQEAAQNGSRFAWETFTDQTLKRMFKRVTDIGISAMKDETKLKRLYEVLTEMQRVYSTGKVSIDGKLLEIEPGLQGILSKSRDYNELLDVWKSWRDAVGKNVKTLYKEYVRLHNDAVRDAGYEDTGSYWRGSYEDIGFRQNIDTLYTQLAPLYKEMHAYVRYKLKAVYGAENFPTSGHIPAHLLGNMWAQNWMNIFPLVKPYDKEDIDTTQAMLAQNYTAVRMFEVAEEFFTSLGLPSMPETFWNMSILVKPDDGRKFVCHPSAWDLLKYNDVRIKMCTEVNTDDLITVHHEMGHIEYYLLYSNQSFVFRKGANNGFHEAIGDVIKLSVLTPNHLQKINLLENVIEDDERDINFLLKLALDEIAFIPFAYLMDRWRWGVFSGDVTFDVYNRRWWEHRCNYQGISAPVERTEEDFDAGAKYHIPHNVPYVRYFVASVLKFQFHKSLCAAANQTGALHKCDIYQSIEAGDLLRSVLSLGLSKPWPDALEIITGVRAMNAEAFVEYFQSLLDWLKAYNAEHNVELGWTNDCPNMEAKPRVCDPSECDTVSVTCDDTGSVTCDSSIMLTAAHSVTVLLAVLICWYHV